MTTIVSGIQPTGDIHLGNYLGAVRRWANLPLGATAYLFLADLHAITQHLDPVALRQGIRAQYALLRACGIQDAHLFRQSHIGAHAELQWLLMGTARMGWLNRMTQFKSKAGGEEGTPVGLFAYPVLQAADILLYGADEVPVGGDQLQHLELTRDIADKFNRDFSPVFKLPVASMPPATSLRVMSLQDPTLKMSKSDPNASSRINLLDSDDLISRKFRAAVADSHAALPSDPQGLEGRVAVTNLVNLLAGLLDVSFTDALDRVAGKGNGNLKRELTDAAIHIIEPIRRQFEERIDQWDLDDEIACASVQPSQVAYATLERVKDAMGL